MNKYELYQHMAFIRWRNGYKLQSRLPKAQIHSQRSLEFHSHFGARSVRTICQPSLDTPKETFKGKCDSISRGAQLHKRRGVAEPQLHWFTSRLFQGSELCSLKRQVQSHQEHTVIFTTFNSKEKGNNRIETTRWAHQSASWGVLWGRPSVGRHSCRRDIWTVSPQSATWCASAGSPSG